ncbi:MAG: DUF2254 domain-containing protein [Solirubrobacterales bacterium]
MTWRAKWRIREYIRNSIWIIPALFAVAAIALGIIVPDLELLTTFEWGVDFESNAARSVLGSLAAGMIAFTGFVFSILLLAVQFGSSQFSPRMLRRFLRDTTTKVALGLFIATFIYSLLVLSSVGISDEDQFVPSTSVELAIVLLLLSMFWFLRLISTTTQGLRVANVLRELGDDGREAIEWAYPDPALEHAEHEEASEVLPDGAHTTVRFVGSPGAMQSIDHRGLVRFATRSDLVIELVPPIGDFLVVGEPLFRVYGSAGFDEEEVLSMVATGDERVLRQDPAFAFRLLADISAKALSPGINDPGTATQALDQVEVLLRLLATRRLTPGVLRDDAGVVRLHYPAPSWEDYLSVALDETRQYGEGSVQVARRMYALLHDLRNAVPAYRRPAIEPRLVLMRASVRRGFSDDHDRYSASTADRQGIGSPRSEMPIHADTGRAGPARVVRRSRVRRLFSRPSTPSA